MRYRPQWILLILCSLWAHTSFAQTWTPVEQQNIIPTGTRDIIPQTCAMFSLDYLAMKEILWTAPYEYAQSPSNSNTIITVPLGDGTADMFKVVQYDMMEALLAAQFPDMKTFRGISVSDPYRTIRADWTKNGFRAVITDLTGKTYIDPYQRNDLATRIVYCANTYSSQAAWTCGMTEDPFQDGDIHLNRRFGDCQFRTYRLAMATTGEYSNFFGATSPSQSGIVLSQVVTAINRVNEVYEADIAVRLILIGNTTSVFYYDPGNDPFSADACTQLTENQNNMTAVIGSANYDVGHVFGVGSGGCAGLGVICNNAQKARGATGLNPPTGDAFYIDYVAHELGHQFGGNHTFNGTAGSCGGSNRSAGSAYEPGSGTTIMAYAGICGAQDIQPHSDDYFHARSLLEISNKLLSTNCAAFITLNNDAPVAASVPDYTIPISTPFVLTANVTDPNGDPLTYCWEEYDLEATSSEPPTSDDIDGPMFRSYSPVSIPQRYFPRLEDLTQNVSSIWEVLPSVGRTMNYRMTARDYHSIAGCTDEDDVVVTTSANSGPFVVTSQNAATTWTEGSTVTVTWNVANTTAAPVSCANVDIKLSLNGGMTYPTTLLLNQPNNGTATFSIPAGAITTTGRVMVKGSNNIFFDINNANITINAGLPNFTISLNPSTVSECNDGSVQTSVVVGQFMGYTDPVTLSVLNLPPGATASFMPQVVNPGSSSTLTISNLTGLFGTYTPTIRGTSTTGNKDAVFTINLLAPPTITPTLVSPANNTANAVITPLLDWQSIAGATSYEYQVAYDNAFTLIALSGTVLTDQYQVTTPLIVGQQHFWRVRAANSCGLGSWSSAFSFTTISCFSLMSSNVPITIPAAGTPTVLSVFNSPIDMVINDVNVINLTGTHSWVDDLKFSLISPDGTERLIWNQPCDNHDNFNINFDDEAANNSWPCPPTNGLTYKPDNTLSIFDAKHSNGVWTLKIQDVANQDGGSLSSWGLNVCGDLGCQLIVNQTSGTGTGSLPAAISCAGAGDTIRLSVLLSGQTVNIGSSPLTINKNLVFLAQGTNINITGSGTRVFEIAAGVQAEFIGMKITAGTSLTGGAINNPGTLKIKDATIARNPAVNGATLIQNTPGAQMIVVGNCFINQ